MSDHTTDRNGRDLIRVLAVVTFFPIPLNHGDAIRRSMILSAAGSFDLTVHATTRDDTTDADVRQLAEAVAPGNLTVHALWQKDLSSLLARCNRIVRGLSNLAPPWIFRQWSPGMASQLKNLDLSSFDVILLVGEPAGLYAPTVRDAKVIWDKSNVLAASDLDAIKSIKSITGKLRGLVSFPLSYNYERRVLKKVTEVWVSSAQEGQRLARIYQPIPHSVVPSAVNSQGDPPLAADEPPVSVSAGASQVWLWMSTFNYLPNWDGLVRFLKASSGVFERENLTLRVVGAGANSSQIDFLATFDFVDYVGYVDDLRDAARGVRGAVVPVWAGAGVKLKTLTLIDLGIPIVATPVAMEGVPEELALRVRESPQELVAEIVASDSQELVETAARSRQALREHFSPEAFVDRVQKLLGSQSS